MYETFFALVVNPRSGRIAQCVLTNPSTVIIADLSSGDLGEGEWNQSMGQRSEDVTRMPRVHLLSGVHPQGEGWGTALYTALAVGAAARADGVLPMARMRTVGRGVSSDPSERTESADAWWDRAVAAGLAYRDESDPYGDGSAYDAYDEQSARDHHLLICRMPHPEDGALEWWDYEPGVVDAVDAEALAALNLSEFGPLLAHDDPERRERHAHQLQWLLELGESSGLSPSVLSAMRGRARAGEGRWGGLLTAPNPRASSRVDDLSSRRHRLGWDALAGIEQARPGRRR